MEFITLKKDTGLRTFEPGRFYQLKQYGTQYCVILDDKKREHHISTTHIDYFCKVSRERKVILSSIND